ncbi:MAG: hypothetical protein JNJ78_14700 [Anaerolineae bacterium]|nr:hypothetical protein [Anaerolineae bacterium]
MNEVDEQADVLLLQKALAGQLGLFYLTARLTEENALRQMQAGDPVDMPSADYLRGLANGMDMVIKSLLLLLEGSEAYEQLVLQMVETPALIAITDRPPPAADGATRQH